MGNLTQIDINLVLTLFDRLPSAMGVGAVLSGLHSDVLSEYYTDEELIFLRSLFTGSYAGDYSPEARQALDRIRML